MRGVQLLQVALVGEEARHGPVPQRNEQHDGHREQDAAGAGPAGGASLGERTPHTAAPQRHSNARVALRSAVLRAVLAAGGSVQPAGLSVNSEPAPPLRAYPATPAQVMPYTPSM